jgi:hypothetical protein
MILRTLGLTAALLAAVPAGVLVAVPAGAQNPQPYSPANPTVPVAPPNSASSPPEKIAPPDGDLGTNLSKRRGMITPPNVDPGMTVNPSRSGTDTMPVIPPPGSSGGNPSIVPK